jgi:hypothetical protein
MHAGTVQPHRVTPGARLLAGGVVQYDAAVQ